MYCNTRDRNISFSSKWGLRYFELVGSTLSYFVDDRDTRPRRVIDLTSCIIVVDGLKRDKYHVVSVVFEGNLLLRISSENAAEMMQWAHMLEVGSRIKQNAASFITLDESSAKNEAENESNIGQVALRRVQSATITLSKARSFASSGALLGSGAFDSTLRSIAPKFSATKSSSSSSSSTGGSQQDSSAGISSSFSSEFPASMPIHVESRPSPLSYDAKQSHQSYRGFFNLGIIILFLSHLRQIMDNANLHGLRVSFSQLYDPSSVHSEVHQFIRLAGQSAIFWCSSILLSFSLEKVASKYFIPERIILCLNFLLGAYNFFVPTLWVWYSEYDPIVSFWFLFQSMILWMKFISYAHVNRDLRRSLRASHQIKSGSLRTKDEDPNGYDNNAKPPTSPAVKDLIMPVIGYPHNITISNLLFFLCVPTLCYQLNYPRYYTISISL